MQQAVAFRFLNSYAGLAAGFHARVAPTPLANARFVLRNYLAERAIRQAEAGDYSEIARLRLLLSRPYDEQPEMAAYAQERPDWGRELLVSCSS